MSRPPRWNPAALAALLLTLSACATSSDPSLRPGGTATILNAEKGRSAVVTGEDAFTAPTVIEAPIDSVWSALLESLPAIGVPIDAIQPSTYSVGTPVTNARREFAGKPISTFLRCGGSAGVADVADAYNVAIGVIASLQPLENGATQLQVQVTGSAKDPFTSVPARHCISKGKLEAQIDASVRAVLARF